MTEIPVLERPYYVHLTDLPGIDFNREIIAPGSEYFPDGAVGIRVDDDFWSVAALPYSYLDTPLEEIVKNFWPEHAEAATYAPDHGTVEQELYFLHRTVEICERQNRDLNRELREREDEVQRLRRGRPDLRRRHDDQLKARNDYFIRQYVQLLTATAHKAEPRADAKGLCRVCGLYVNHGVHQSKYIALREKGVDPYLKSILEYPKEAEVDG